MIGKARLFQIPYHMRRYPIKPCYLIDLKLPCFKKLCFYSPIAMAKNAVGMTLACEEYGASFFANGANPGGVLEHPGVHPIKPCYLIDLKLPCFKKLCFFRRNAYLLVFHPFLKHCNLMGEKGKYFIKFNLDGLLRGDYASRMNGYSVGRQNGWLSANDIREMENMNPIPDEEGGNLYLINGSMTKLKDASRPRFLPSSKTSVSFPYASLSSVFSFFIRRCRCTFLPFLCVCCKCPRQLPSLRWQGIRCSCLPWQ